jgi:hypothetical protein
MMQKKIKLDPAYVKHSKASEGDDRVWFYEELEGEILEFARYCIRKSNVLKGDPLTRAHLKRIGQSIHNMKVCSSLSMGTYENLYEYDK